MLLIFKALAEDLSEIEKNSTEGMANLARNLQGQKNLNQEDQHDHDHQFNEVDDHGHDADELEKATGNQKKFSDMSDEEKMFLRFKKSDLDGDDLIDGLELYSFVYGVRLARISLTRTP